MEKIKYKPLLEHLMKSGELYNQLCRDHELHYGEINPQLLTAWIVRVIEPVVSASAKTEAEAGKIFQCLYRAVLPLLGNQLAVSFEREYQQAWMMLAKAPHLMQGSPSRIVGALNSALQTIRTYKPEKVSAWINLMEQTIPECKTAEDFLRCGRIYAWLSGLAHLREKAMDDIVALSPSIKAFIEKHSSTSLADAIGRHWFFDKDPSFAGVAGGFTGFGGPFRSPPRVSMMDNLIVAADNMSSCALFTDSFGSTIITEVPFTASEIIAQSTPKPFLNFKNHNNKTLTPYNDVTSAVVTKNTLVMTRESSFLLYIYGWHN